MENMAARKKKILHRPKKAPVKPEIYSLLQIVCTLLIIDGLLRFLFALFPYTGMYGSFVRTFQMRWLLVGSIEIAGAYGLLHFKKWALFLLILLSFIRVYTILMYLPQALFPPIQNNALFYVSKIISVVLIFYLFTKRKYFK